MRTILFLGTFIIGLLLFSCKKKEETVMLHGHVMHHETIIPNAKVYLKYGTNVFPGDNVGAYDLSAMASAAAEFSFESIPVGENYLYAVGWDAEISDSVFGGIPIDVQKGTPSFHMNVPVTE